jgi:hypothetical protein
MASKIAHYYFDDFLPWYQEHYDATDGVAHSTDFTVECSEGYIHVYGNCNAYRVVGMIL